MKYAHYFKMHIFYPYVFAYRVFIPEKYFAYPVANIAYLAALHIVVVVDRPPFDVVKGYFDGEIVLVGPIYYEGTGFSVVGGHIVPLKPVFRAHNFYALNIFPDGLKVFLCKL
jgi:hypothetical protein